MSCRLAALCTASLALLALLAAAPGASAVRVSTSRKDWDKMDVRSPPSSARRRPPRPPTADRRPPTAADNRRHRRRSPPLAAAGPARPDPPVLRDSAPPSLPIPAPQWDKAEKQLEDGDDPEELETTDKAHMREMEKRRGQGMKPPPATVGLKDPAEWVKHTQAMAGPAMLFCTLLPNDPRDGKPWGNESLQRMAYEWRELLKTGGLEASVYDISDEKAKRMLVTMQSGWNAYDLRDFLLQRPELEELEWDQVKYHPEDLEGIRANVGKPIEDPLAGFRAQQEREAMLRKAGIDPDGPGAPPPPPPPPAPKKKKAKKPKAAPAGEL